MSSHIFLLGIPFCLVLSMAVPNSARAAMADYRDVVHDANGQVIRNSFGHCVRTQWASGSRECSGKRLAQVPHHQISEEERTVYFEFNKTSLNANERRKLDSLANALKSMDDVQGVSIAGYADRMGTASYNRHLSEQRTKVVENYLRKHGYFNTSVAKTRWLGETESITKCSDKLNRNALISCLQMDRRVTVDMKYKDSQ